MSVIRINEKEINIVNPNNSLATELINSNIYIEHSCLTGRCGKCKLELIEGETELLNDEISLNEEEKKNGFILSCVRKSKTDLVLKAKNIIDQYIEKPRIFPAICSTPGRREPPPVSNMPPFNSSGSNNPSSSLLIISKSSTILT